MLSLFSTSSDTSGFRLQYMEVLNWGTFHNKIFRMEPMGNNALLTGANASGKSTIIDALLTLMVPEQKDRFYNQSSGVEKKGNRTEETYVLGNYGNIQKEGDNGSTTQSLRDKSTYSVLLATFANADMYTVTLFQVRWFAGSELKRAYGIAHTALEIGRDFSHFDGKGNWKRMLEKAYRNSVRNPIEYYDGPVGYAERLRELLGMKSKKALALFNQIVGVKVLDDLDEFIRTNMLEDRDCEGMYIELKDSFKVLMDAKNNIQKTKLQIEKLTPIAQLADEIMLAKQTIGELDADREKIEYWAARKTIDLGERMVKEYELKLDTLKKDEKGLDEEAERLRKEERAKSIAIEKDEVGMQIKDIEKDIQMLAQQRNEKTGLMNEYNSLAQELQLRTEPDKETFLAQRAATEESVEQFQKDQEDIIKEIAGQDKRSADIDKEKLEKMETVKALLKNKNNIPVKESDIRDRILEVTGAGREEIPFVGELVRVAQGEAQWECSIEKILHHFALHMIVPDKYYHEVNAFVNNTNLKGRITYYHYMGNTTLASMQQYTDMGGYVLDKIEIKPDSEYEDWIRDMIYNKYNYACVDTLEELERVKEKAVTSDGLIKFSHERHEKDDREHVVSRQNFVLGWDNKEKIDLLKEAIARLDQEKEELKLKCEELNRRKAKIQKVLKNSNLLVEKFTDYSMLNWQECAEAIQKKKAEKEELEKHNEAIRMLEKQIEAIKEELKGIEQKKKEINKDEALTEARQKQVNMDMDRSRVSIKNMKTLVLDNFEESHPELRNCMYDEVEPKSKSFKAEVINERKKQEKALSKAENKATTLISQYKRPKEEVLEKYKDWRSDVSALPESVEMIGEYQELLARLEHENLPKYEKEFNTYLERTLTDKVGDFSIFFRQWNESIDKSIRMLNDSLRNINYHKHPHETYIKLVKQNKPNESIKEFRSLMREAMPNVQKMNSTVDGRDIHFREHIEPFMKRLEDENWRREVMNVRGWFTYKAEEFNRETQVKETTYENMGHLSGGEKAQLTYTILGSAIAYQFGIAQNGMQENSFRFIAIDEAFKAQDEEKARYLIELCNQLHLQLLVVTPNDNINIVEDDISFVYFVERKQNKTSWLYSMPIQQWKEEKEVINKVGLPANGRLKFE